MFKLSNGSHSQLRKMPAMAMCRCPLSTSADFGHRSPFYILLSVRLGKIKYGAFFAPFQKLVLFMSHFHIIAAEFLILNKDYIIWSTSWFPDFFWCNQWKLVAWWRVWRFKKSEKWNISQNVKARHPLGIQRGFRGQPKISSPSKLQLSITRRESISHQFSSDKKLCSSTFNDFSN